MLKDKQLSQLDKYDGSTTTSGYRQWRETLRALIAAQGDGVAWEKILDELERMRETIVSVDEVKRLMVKFKLKKRHVKIINSNLCHMPQK